jgi:peptidoglycan hydrolase-like protein with peptidoglycan-binding domain
MTIQMGSRGAAVKDVQLKLEAAGFDPGDIDGIFGRKTLAALKGIQEEYDQLEITGCAATDRSRRSRSRREPAVGAG